jgi:hypothetical protein
MDLNISVKCVFRRTTAYDGRKSLKYRNEINRQARRERKGIRWFWVPFVAAVAHFKSAELPLKRPKKHPEACWFPTPYAPVTCRAGVLPLAH